MKEIVTIQLGNYANFVGSHFWNFQDELLGLADSPDSDQIFRNHGLNMDILYRMGETQQGILTYTPRLVSVDFQGSLGTMSSHGTLYNEIPETSRDISTWTGPVTTHRSQPSKKNLFLQSLYDEEGAKSGSSISCESGNNNSRTEVQDKDIVDCLENGVLYWTDFSKVHYHPQSIYELSGLWSDVQEFNNYGIGKEAFSGGLRADEISERLRFFIEECDLPQGFQFIIDDSGGFSGVAAEFLENISDEYTNIPVLLYSVRSPEFCSDPGSRIQTISRKLHNAVSFTKLSAFCKLIVPVGLPSLNVGKYCYHLRSKRASISEAKEAVQAAYYASPIEKKARFSHLSIAQCPLPIPLPFPSIFKNLVGRDGELLDTPISDCAFTRGSLEVHSVPMAARLRSSNAILPFLEGRLESLRKFGISRGGLGTELLKSWGFEREDVEEMGETLSGMVMALNSGSQMLSDSD
ncbi:Unknown protein [Striga hermonthica]|uniref:Uncharacterized protein n=1 Tax=Striga hermonthica TaxID=68872 RepID=A0A9N7N8U5_STRHE|nr:Unknown protein [Striga hermonthica]